MNFLQSGQDQLSQQPGLGFLDDSQQKGQAALQDAKNAYGDIGLPGLTWTNYSPGAYTAATAQGTQIQDDPMVKSAQMAALAKMGDLANTGMSAVDQQGYQQARDLGNQMANSGSQAAMQNAASRGLAGSGMEFANREIANQQGAQRAQQAGLQQAADSARQRALYNQAYSGALGQQRQQDLGLNSQNAGIINQFNMANTQNRNAAQQYNVGNQNQAQLVNNQGRNDVAQNLFSDKMQRANGIAGADSGIAKGYGAENAANTAGRNQTTGMVGSLLGGIL